MPWPRRIRITRGQGSLNRFALIIWAEDLSFSGLSPESLCTLFQDRNASTNSRCRLTPVKETKVCPVCDTPIEADARVPFVPDGPDLVRHRRGHGPSRDARKGRTEHR